MDLNVLSRFSVRLTLVMALLLAAYLAWIFSSRKSGDSKGPSFNPVAKELATDELKILQFYATSGSAKTLLCYGVLNAVSVRLDPPVEEIKPSLNRCLEVSPARDTKYTLHAQSASGATAEAQVIVPGK